jgi:phosphonate transport system substrate-binding protein
MRMIQILLVILICVVPLPLFAGDASYKLSMLPLYSPEEINRRISIIADYLTKKTGARIEGVVNSDFTQYENSLKNGSIEFGYENPYVYTLVSSTHEVLAMDQDTFGGIIIARTDSGLSTLKDVRGKKISIVGKKSVGGYLSQKLSLMEAGINVDTDCSLTEAVANKQENVILAVYTGEADAGFIRESALHQVDNYISSSQIKVISVCAKLPGWAFSVKKTLPAKLKQDIQAALLALKQNDPVLQAFKIESFKSATDTDYDSVRRASGAKP